MKQKVDDHAALAESLSRYASDIPFHVPDTIGRKAAFKACDDSYMRGFQQALVFARRALEWRERVSADRLLRKGSELAGEMRFAKRRYLNFGDWWLQKLDRIIPRDAEALSDDDE